MPAPELVVDYAPRAQFVAFHCRTERFACIVTHRRAGKTVACIHDLQGGAIQSVFDSRNFSVDSRNENLPKKRIHQNYVWIAVPVRPSSARRC